MLPKISAICVTYGRHKLLENSIACFLAQRYDGEKELVVFNTNPAQMLLGIFPSVRIINCQTRPPTLGDARNLAIENATGDIIVTWDDDDLFTSNHLQNVGFPMVNESVTWVWLDRQFYAEGNQIFKLIDGQLPCFAFRKSAWQKAGGYQALTVGEDRNFAGRITQAGYGETVRLQNHEISFIYCWGNGAYHISGLGEDRKGLQPAHERAKDDLETRVRRGEEPTGKVHLQPKFKVQPEYMVERFLTKADEIETPRPQVCIIELGRYGDIINILPVCRHIAEAYEKPHLMVSREFASVLDGVSYVVPEIVDWPNDCLQQAMTLAKKKFPIVLRAQIWGKGHIQEHECASYNKESWKILGFKKEFGLRLAS